MWAGSGTPVWLMGDRWIGAFQAAVIDPAGGGFSPYGRSRARYDSPNPVSLCF